MEDGAEEISIRAARRGRVKADAAWLECGGWEERLDNRQGLMVKGIWVLSGAVRSQRRFRGRAGASGSLLWGPVWEGMAEEAGRHFRPGVCGVTRQ